MYGCQIWTVKKDERRKIDAFELWCWRLLRVPWTARRSSQSILKEISPGCSLEGLMLKLKLPIMWPPHVKSWLIGKDPDAGRDWGQEEKGTTEDEMVGWHHRLDGHEFEWTQGVGVGHVGLACCDSWGHRESDVTERLNWTDWTEREPLYLAHHPKEAALLTWGINQRWWKVLRPQQPQQVFIECLSRPYADLGLSRTNLNSLPPNRVLKV